MTCDPLELEIQDPYVGSAVSPTVDITETETTITVNITDFRGVHSYTVQKTDGAIAEAEQAAAIANAAAQYARDTADQAAADAQETADEAAGRADTAAASATQAASNANSAATSASEAASNANTKANLAEGATANANAATECANTAAGNANSATAAAQTAAGQATTAAGNANTATETANTAAGNADAKAQLADTAATNADTATQAANTATTAAINAAQAANNAADYAIEAADDMPKLVNTASGTTAQTVNDAWPTTIESATVYGKSVQDGTPTPSAPVEVQVVGGRNLLIPRNYSTTVSGVTFTDNGDNTFTLNGTATASADYIIATADTPNVLFVQPGAYNFSAEGLISGVSAIISGGGTNGYPYRELTVDNPSRNGTATSAGKFNYIMLRVANGTAVNTTVKLQLEAGTTETPFIQYGSIGLQIGETVTPIDLQGYGIPEGDLLRVDSTGHVTIEKGETPNIIDLGTIELPELTNPCELAIYASLDPEWAIEYEQDPNLVVHSLQSSIAPVEGGTASTNYAVNSYLIHGNQLYRVTSAIATGEAITPGSNCVACTVMGEVVRLTA